MRSAALICASLAAFVGGCAATPLDTNEPLSRACTRTNCFFERNVRDFEVIDQTTLIVYVGGQRCPFLVELDGIFCDMTFTPTIEFRGGDSRICSFDRGQVDSGPFGRSEESCRIREVRSLTDDEVVELFVDRGVLAPPPPVGQGEIRVGGSANGESSDEPGDAAPGEPAPTE